MQEALTGNRNTKGRWQAATVFILPFLLFGLAWFMYFSGYGIPDGRTNKGKLILPPGQFQQLQLFRENQPFTIEQLGGRWAVVIFGSGTCSDSLCQESLYKTRQVHIGLGREADRVVRLFVSQDSPKPDSALKDEHPAMQWLRINPSSLKNTLSTRQSVEGWPANHYFIVDPLGNIIMEYQPEQTGGDLLKDMQRLLKASNVG